MGATPLKAVTNSFPQVGGNQTTKALKVIFDPTQGDKGMETSPPPPPPQCLLKSLPQLASVLSEEKIFKQRVKLYHQWLYSTIHFKTITSQSSPDSLRIQGPSK